MKTKTILVLLVVFVAGGFFGAFLAGRTFKHRIHKIEEDRKPEVFRERMHKMLNTTEEQKVAIDSVFDAYLPKIQEQRKRHRAEMRTLHQEMMNQVEKRLDPEQVEKLEKFKRRLMHEHAHDRRHPGPGRDRPRE